MKIKLTKTEQTIIETEVPMFFSTPFGGIVYKVLDNEYCLYVCPDNSIPMIAKGKLSANYRTDMIEITEELFNEKFEETKKNLNI